MVFPRKHLTPSSDLPPPPPPPSWYDTMRVRHWVGERRFLKRSVEVVRCYHDHKVLIIMDGHSSQSRNLDAIQYARNDRIIILCLPLHAAHKLQTLDVSFFKAFKTACNKTCREWMVSYPGDRITTDHIEY